MRVTSASSTCHRPRPTVAAFGRWIEHEPRNDRPSAKRPTGPTAPVYERSVGRSVVGGSSDDPEEGILYPPLAGIPGHRPLLRAALAEGVHPDAENLRSAPAGRAFELRPGVPASRV